MRTHAEWNVLTHMIFARPPTSSATRSRISAAALLVNVIARIEPGWALRSEISQAIRRVSTRVLPEPAPGDDEQRRPLVDDGLALRLVEPLEQLLAGRSTAPALPRLVVSRSVPGVVGLADSVGRPGRGNCLVISDQPYVRARTG